MIHIYQLFLTLLFASALSAQTPAVQAQPQAAEVTRIEALESLEAPLYSPFIERYVLDELKSLRTELAAQKHELMQQILDREHNSVDRAVAYSTDTITYFFYLIAGVSSLLVIMGLTSMRDLHRRIRAVAEERVTKLINVYETRLEKLEALVKQKTQHIEENREEIERTQEIQALWLRAAQENSPAQKIAIYDEILKHNTNDVEALTYKAHSVLNLNEPQWAANLCAQALKIDSENSQAYYQLARACTALNLHDDAIQALQSAIHFTESYRNELMHDDALKPLEKLAEFQKLTAGN